MSAISLTVSSVVISSDLISIIIWRSMMSDKAVVPSVCYMTAKLRIFDESGTGRFR